MIYSPLKEITVALLKAFLLHNINDWRVAVIDSVSDDVISA